MPETQTKFENEQRLPSGVILRRACSYWLERPGLLAVIVILHLFVIALELAEPDLIGRCAQAYQESSGKGGDSQLIWFFAGLFCLVVIAKNIGRFFRNFLNTRQGMSILGRYWKQLHEKFQKLSFSYHDNSSTGTLIARATRDVEKVSQLYWELALNGTYIVISMVGVVGIFYAYHWKLGLMLTGVFVLTLMAIFSYAAKLGRMWREVADSYDHVTHVIQENVAGVRVVRAFGQEKREESRFGLRIRDYKKEEIRAGDFFTARMPGSNGVFHFAIPLTMIIGGALAVKGELSYHHLVAGCFYLLQFQHRLRMLGRMVEIMQHAVASGDRIFTLLDDESVIPAPQNPKPIPTNAGRVELNSVFFRFDADDPAKRDRRKWALENFSVKTEDGEILGVLGRTGSGKSTLASLIPRYYEVVEGEVKLGGINVKEFDPIALRRAVAVVYQDSFLFSASIRDNIRFGCPEAPEEEVIAAAKAAQIHDFIAGLKEGYDTIVGERGISLSGGQKQRVAIARALMMRPNVLILDDATSSVDARTEQALQKSMIDHARGATIIVISQRVSSLRMAQRILVLEGGRLTQEGGHESLVNVPGLYREIYESQMFQTAQ